MTQRGNYHKYQGIGRHAGLSPAACHVLDPRLALLNRLVPGIFHKKAIVDYGCNSGSVSVQLGFDFHADLVKGVDVDPSLISQAKSHLAFRWSRVKPDIDSPRSELSSKSHYFPVSAVLLHGHRPLPTTWHSSESDGDAKLHLGLPSNIQFECQDWASAEDISRSKSVQYRAAMSGLDKGSWDVILALSVIKWIHLQHQDQGLYRFFCHCASILRPGGYFVIEVQPWSSYEKAIKPNKAPQLALNFASLAVKPSDFARILAEEGFEHVLTSEELPRSIEIYRKGAQRA